MGRIGDLDVLFDGGSKTFIISHPQRYREGTGECGTAESIGDAVGGGGILVVGTVIIPILFKLGQIGNCLARLRVAGAGGLKGNCVAGIGRLGIVIKAGNG